MSADRDLWEESVPAYLHHSREIEYCGAVTRELLRWVDPETLIFVDFGCGDGRLSRAFLSERLARARTENRILDVVLADRSPSMLRATEDLGPPGVRLHRHLTDATLVGLPPSLVGRIDTIACNCSLHLLRRADDRLDLDTFFRRCAAVLRPGGQVVANLPDQSFAFADGWESRFHRAAQRLRPDSPERAEVEKLDSELLAGLARRHGFGLELEPITFSVDWEDFVRFYSIPAMGRGRLPHLSQAERVAFLRRIEPGFDHLPYRWVFARWTFSGEPPCLEPSS